MNKEKNKELFETVPVRRAVAEMAIPTIIAQLIVLIYNMADTFFIGRTNDPYMVAAASLILPVFNVCPSIGNIAGVGGGSLISRLLGVGREDEARRVSSFCIRLSAALALLFSMLVFVFMRPLLTALGAGEETFAFARSYALCVVVFGALPAILTNVFANLVRSIGESKKAGFGVTMGGIINILLDPLFMFVLLPEGMEILGAGVATCLSNYISCAYYIIIIRRLGKDRVLRLLPLRERPEGKSIKKIFSVGLPSSLTTLLFDLDYVVIDRLMSGYSDIALAAVGIVLKAERLPLNVDIGICQGMVPIVAYNYSSGNRERMRAAAKFALRCGIIFALASIVMYECFAPYILRFFINDAPTVALGTNFLRFRTPATVMMFMCFYHVNLFNGYGRGEKALLLGVSRWVVFNIPMLFILNYFVGMYGIVLAQFVADSFMAALSFAIHRSFRKKEMPD